MDIYVNGVYNYTELFPKSEIFGLTSQFRRAALSAVLNYNEIGAMLWGIIKKLEKNKE